MTLTRHGTAQAQNTHFGYEVRIALLLVSIVWRIYRASLRNERNINVKDQNSWLMCTVHSHLPPPALPPCADEAREVPDDLLVDSLHRRALQNDDVHHRFPAKIKQGIFHYWDEG